MTFDKNSRLFVLPGDAPQLQGFKWVFAGKSRTLLSDGNNIYETVEVSAKSPFQLNGEPLTTSETAVKSIILEPKEIHELGFSIPNANLIYCSTFDMLYPITAFLYENILKLETRYHSIDDVIDYLEEYRMIEPSSWVSYLREPIVQSLMSLGLLINENGEEYLKFDYSRLFECLKDRVDALSNYILTDRNSALYKKSLTDLGGEEVASPEMIKTNATRLAMDMVFDSYLNLAIKLEYAKRYDHNFQELDSIIASQKKTSQRSEPRIPEKREQPVAKKRKSAPSKVAVGKGALDAFFKPK